MRVGLEEGRGSSPGEHRCTQHISQNLTSGLMATLQKRSWGHHIGARPLGTMSYNITCLKEDALLQTQTDDRLMSQRGEQ